MKQGLCGKPWLARVAEARFFEIRNDAGLEKLQTSVRCWKSLTRGVIQRHKYGQGH